MTSLVVALIGATGLTGREVLRQLLERGHEVRALVRTPSKLSDINTHPRLTLVQGDATTREDVVRIMEGVDAVLSTIGPVGGARLVCATTTKHVLGLLGPTRRYVVLGGAGTPMPTDQRRWFGRRIQQIMGIVGGAMQDDKHAEVATLLSAKDGQRWTLVRAPIILRGRTLRHLTLNPHSPTSAQVNTASLAATLIDQLTDPRFVAQGVFVG